MGLFKRQKAERKGSETDFVDHLIKENIEHSIRNGRIIITYDYAGPVDLGDTSGVSTLPENLTIEGHLAMRLSETIASLPAGLHVTGMLSLEDSRITAIPANLTVDGDLVLDSTKITTIPGDAKIGGCLRACFESALKTIPDGFTVGSDLDLRGTKITRLPKNLTVGGGLYLDDLAISELPKGLKVRRDISLKGTKVDQSIPIADIMMKTGCYEVSWD